MSRNIKVLIWFPVIVLAAFAVGYLSWAKATFNWPFDDTFYPYPENRNNAPQPPLSLRGGEGELKSWQTYRNEEYGFEFKYAEDYFGDVDELGWSSEGARHAVEMKNVLLTVSDNAECKPLADEVAEMTELSRVNYTKSLDDLASGIVGIEVNSRNSYPGSPFNIDFVLSKESCSENQKNYFIIFTVRSGDYLGNEVVENVEYHREIDAVSKILSTFRFIEP